MSTADKTSTKPGTKKYDSPVDKRNIPHKIRVDRIKPHPGNPRRDFNEAELQELADSMLQHGLLQPILVRRLENKNLFELIAGERRLRAAALAGWTHIPVIVREATDAEVLAMLLIENVQRKDLNAVEIARGFDQLCRPEGEGGVGKSPTEVAKLIGRSQAHVSAHLQLLKLPESWQTRIVEKTVSYKNALHLVPFVDRPEVFERVERDMQEKPWAWRQAADFARNVQLVAEEGPWTPTEMRPKNAVTGFARSAVARPITEVKSDSPVLFAPIPETGGHEPFPTEGPAPDCEVRESCIDLLITAIYEIADVGELDRIAMAIADRRDQLSDAIAAIPPSTASASKKRLSGAQQRKRRVERARNRR